MEASDKTPLECVQEVDEERTRLEEEVEWMMTEDPENPRLNQVKFLEIKRAYFLMNSIKHL